MNEMDIASTSAQLGANVQVAMQAKMLDAMKVQGAQIAAMIASAGAPVGSVNSPSQGTNVDAYA